MIVADCPNGLHGISAVKLTLSGSLVYSIQLMKINTNT